jgi:hypothetical protein
MDVTIRPVGAVGRGIALVTAAVLAIGVLTFVVPAIVAPQPAAATDLSAFDPGLIITDDQFYDGTAMSATAVQSFLVSKDPDCVSSTVNNTKYTCLADFTQTTNTRAAGAECHQYTGKSNETAATIIARVAVACNISPKVILVTLQKEQSFITTGARSSLIYRKAMGYGCPDTANCDSKYYGFFNQVYSAAWQFEHYRLNPSHYSIRAGQTDAIRYSPDATCGHANVYVRNAATAGLYTYTPYTPNAAELQGKPNSCSSSGNANFFSYFSSWFGNPADLLKSAGFESGLSSWASGSNGAVSHTVRTSSADAQAGTHYLAVSTTSVGRSIRQYVSRSGKNGGLYLAGVWVKSDKPGVPFSGILKASSTGGAAIVDEQPFTAGDDWTWVQTQLSVNHTGVSSLRFSVILNTKGSALDLDGAVFYLSSEQEPTTAVTLHSPSFEKTLSGWTKNTTSGVTDAVKKTTGAESGSYVLSAKASKADQSVRQTVSLTPAAGDSYVLGAWVKESSSDTADSYTGRLRLATTGGTQDASYTTFTADKSAWTYVSTTLDIANSGHTALVPDIRLDTLGQTLLVDNVTLTPNLMTGGSFEGSISDLTQRDGTTVMSIVDGSSLGVAPIDDQTMFEMSNANGVPSSVSLGDHRTIAGNDSYTMTAWVRSAVAGHPVTGRLRLWGVGGTAPDSSNEVSFTTTDTWTKVTVSHAMTADRTGIRSEILLDTPSTDAMLVDRLQVR